MPTFGNTDIIQDQNGNVLPNVTITVYASQSNATSQTSPLGSASTNSKGQWPITVSGLDQVWARDPSGNIWVVASDTVAGDHAARLTALETAGYAPGSGSTVYETQSHASSTYETQSHASSTYAPASGSGVYESQAHAASTYAPATGSTSYAPITGSTTYETQSHAAATYAPATGSGVYETQAHASSTYETSSHASSTYQTQAGLDASTGTNVTTGGTATRTALDGLYALPASPGAFNLPIRNAANTGLVWTTSQASVARALGWAIVTDPAYGAVADCNGTQGNGTDNLTAFTNACAAGQAWAPPGVYRCSGQITVPKSLRGAGGGQPAVAGSAATTIVFDSGVSGVKLTGIAAHIEGVYLLGGGGTTNDGITVQNTWTVTRDVSVKGFSRHGYNVDTSGSGIYDQSQVDVLHVYNCGGNGVNIVGGADSNAGTFKAIDSIGNIGWGIWVQAAARNSFIGGHLSANIAGGIHDDGNSNMYDVYIEGGTGNTLDFGSTSSYGIFYGRNYAMPTMTGSYISNALSSWEVHESGALRGQVAVRDSTPANTTRWGLRAGSYGGGWLEIVQFTSGTRLMRVDSTLAASYWNTHFRPDGATGTFDMGSAANGWRNVYATGIVQAPAPQTLASAGAVTIAAGSGDAAITLQANATSSSITGAVANQVLRITWIQDATGGRTYAWPANCKFAGGAAPADTTANKQSTVTFRYDGANWQELSRAVAVG